jgi:acyl-CoA thioesterase-1
MAARSMQLHKGRIFLLCALVASLICNLLLGLTARYYYIATKLRAVEPVFPHHFSQQNSALRVADGHQLIVMFGDSRIDSWNPGPRVEGYDLANRGIAGETTAQMLYRFQSDVLALRPRVVIMQAGINDMLAAGLAPAAEAQIFAKTVANLLVMVGQAKSSGIQVILLTIIPPAEPGILRRLLWSDRIALLVAEANRQLALLHAPPLVHVIDTQRVLQTAPGVWKSNVILDTLHLAPAGYAELDSAVVRVLVKP